MRTLSAQSPRTSHCKIERSIVQIVAQLAIITDCPHALVTGVLAAGTVACAVIKVTILTTLVAVSSLVAGQAAHSRAGTTGRTSCVCGVIPLAAVLACRSIVTGQAVGRAGSARPIHEVVPNLAHIAVETGRAQGAAREGSANSAGVAAIKVVVMGALLAH